ncbi:MAG: hypothetical protein H7338_14580 [Candidatus Sericytochromatia bacterium]|nr:hypothetical protein [Candidatus Sericytochromatia bacterium]
MITLNGGSLSMVPFYNATVDLKRSVERLSSGLRINRAADDAAGLAISSGLESQIRGTAQAVGNSQDSMNLLRTGEGGMSQIAENLRRLRELLVQANNDTYTAADREKMQAEVVHIIDGIDEIATNTEFNGKILLRRLREFYTVTNTFTMTVPPNGMTSVSFTIPSDTIRTTATADFSSEFALGNPFPDLNVQFASGVLVGSQALDATAPPPSVLNGNTGGTAIANTDPVDGPLIAAAMTDYSYSGTNTPIETMTFTSPIAGPQTLIIDNNSPAVGGAPPITPGATFDITVQSFVRVTESNGLQDPRSPHAVYFHLGPNEGQTVRFELPEASAFGLNLLGIDLTRIDNPGASTRAAVATDYFNRIDAALASVNTSRAKFGSLENRLEHNVSNMQLGGQNMAASQSRILDTDMAAASADLVRDQIKMQASTAMLSQAGDFNRSVIQGLIGTGRG